MNDHYDLLNTIYLIVDRKKNTTLIAFAMIRHFHVIQTKHVTNGADTRQC